MSTIVLGPNTGSEGQWLGSYWVYGVPPDSLSLTTSGPLSGDAYFGSDVGAYTLGTFPLTPAGPEDGNGNFPTDIFQSLSVALPSGDLSGMVNIQNVEDPPTAPAIVGVFDITSGSGLFAPDVGVTAPFDAVLIGPSLDDLAANGGHTDLGISAGEVQLPSPIPEPSFPTGNFVLAMVLVAVYLATRRGTGATGP